MQIFTYKLNSYEELLDNLKPGKSLNQMYNSLIYRGQAIDWELIPSAFRKDQENKLFNFFDLEMPKVIYEFQSEKMHRIVENFYLAQFYKHANNIGLKLPKPSFKNVLYTDWLGAINSDELISCEWITDDLSEIAALAQHYGAPTRLLDWSFDIYVALYFASSTAVKMIVNSDIENHKNVNTDYLIVWAILHNILEYEIDLKPNEAPPIRFVIPNYSNNPNICAQKGILSYWKSPKIKDNFKDKVLNKPLDALLKDFEYEFEDSETLPVLIKYKIPISESLTILKHISSLGYNASTMFPGYYGVKQKLDEDIMIKLAEPIFKEKFEKTNLTTTAARDTLNNSEPSIEQISKSDIDKIKEAQKQEY